MLTDFHSTMVWASSLDVVEGPHADSAASALSLHTNREVISLKDAPPTPQPIQSCYISNCDQPCAEDYESASTAPDKKGHTSHPEINHGCSNGGRRTFCCPPNNMPTCRWVGKGPACWYTGCNADESPVTYATGGCSSGHKTLCCTNTKSDMALSQCCTSCERKMDVELC